MHRREIRPGISMIATLHWELRRFDPLTPLPDGTSYNTYLIEGSEETALLDSTDPTLREERRRRLSEAGGIVGAYRCKSSQNDPTTGKP